MEQVNLEIIDIVNAHKIIEAALDRGTFKAAELSGVVALYDKLSAYLKQQETIAAELAVEHTPLVENEND